MDKTLGGGVLKMNICTNSQHGSTHSLVDHLMTDHAVGSCVRPKSAGRALV